MTQNVKELIQALRQVVNAAILESNEVAAVMDALRSSGKCPVFTIDISLQEAPGPTVEPPASRNTEELVLGDADVEFLGAIGISDPSWCSTSSGTA